jgi:membrane-bound metal-dependent hydrolase YbcI (DUF457 family)
MCTGRTHAMQGAIVGLAIPTLYPVVASYTPTVPAVLLGAMLAAGGALLPDLDVSCSTASESFGPITDIVSAGVRALSRAAFALTATPADRRRNTGTHRGLTHTGLGVLGFGALTTWITSFGLVAALVTVFAMVFLALRGLPPVERNITDLATAAGVTGLTWWLLASQPVPSWWIGAAIAAGCLTHVAGDAMTTHGVPFLWPLPLTGRTWRPLGTPRFMRFETDQWVENRPLLWLNTAVLAVLLVNLTPGGHEGLQLFLHVHAPTA